MDLGILKGIKLGLLMAFLLTTGFNLQAYAESGSSQAVMALIVPGNGFNMMTVKNPTQQNNAVNHYDTDTNISMLQTTKGMTYQVWVAI